MAKNKRILITGAEGFIGSHLVDQLIGQGEADNLRLFVYKDKPLQSKAHNKLDIYRGDITNDKDVTNSMKGIDTVYHLAAKIDFDGKTYDEYEDVNVTATRKFLEESSKKKGFKKFVFYSSIGVYGLPADVGDIVGYREDRPKSYSNLYGRSKKEAEDEVIIAHERWGIPYSIIRPASVYGPREKGPTHALYKAIKNNQFIMIGDGENKMHYVFVKDLVDATLLAAGSKKKASDYIIAGDKPTRFRDVVKAVSISIGKKPLSQSIPKSLALGLSYPIELACKIIGIKPPIYPSRVRTMTSTYYYDISKARRELKYNPKVSFDEGARITGKWYMKKGWL